MITKEFAVAFANEWIESWNSHDINAIMVHYAESIDFTSPFIVELTNDPNGTISNKKDLTVYFSRALAKYLNLYFELLNTFVSVNSIVIQYKSVNKLLAAEYMEFDNDGKVIRVKAHYTKDS